ncbi:hypothetical protein VSX64_17165 [Aurantimonas sp. C2-6-R+9]|uniref:hypothetical protein n=1 Tax=unclassified Aurantimonas TaxID=2638230 RepID=UPI002E175133|nr:MULTISPECIES: hypothetical protein [unclassified Aurantimonas]MEC5292319.1 hypothetical protein [Aurantimonas sp. C2-3-R2]MEC5382577.1 hypothetical protein [Aurantimonas sp. C2-6-R+9]MEC5413404.1 hypothetical protein [Aurantimonas sp. C2-4-R8]
MTTKRYAYEHVSSEILSEDMQFGEGAPKPGERLPEFDLPTAGGGQLKTSDLAGRPILLVTGSFTCPMTASSDPILKEFHAKFGSIIEFITLYVREAHPGEHHDQAGVGEEKRAAARALKSRDQLPWTVAVDGPDGSVHRRLDEKPNAAYLTDWSGTIVFRSLWAGDQRGLARALEAVAKGERPPEEESTRRLVPMARGVGTMREMTRRAGPRAQSDLWRAAPPMGVMAWLADLYRPLPPAWRTAAAAATLGVGVAVLATIVFRSTNRRL